MFDLCITLVIITANPIIFPVQIPHFSIHLSSNMLPSKQCRGRGIRSKVTLRTPALVQLKEHTGFLVSSSLTLRAAPPDDPQALFDDFPVP